jgi:DNA-binding NarL/FixJ family response regulator
VTPARRVLIADDEPLIRETLADLLAEEGFEIVGTVGDGRAAVTAAAELRPEVVLIDVRMPIVNGIEATRLIVEAVPDAVVIALSAYDDTALASATLEAGARDYVAKGTPSRELLDRIRAAISAG